MRIAAFVSGAIALVYQIAWHRVLFLGLGRNMESVTLIVTAFLLGLGLGNALGGWISWRYDVGRLRVILAGIEVAIGLFGLISVRLFSGLTLSIRSTSILLASSLAILLIPTTLMGGALPLIVRSTSHRSGQVKSMGGVYALSAFGGALGAALATQYSFAHHGVSGTVLAAGLANLALGLALFMLR